jgi:branched-chain amino acid transport system ATP-binding protein
MTTLLSVNNLCTGYGSGQVLFDLDLQIGAGQMATLLGRNGMGKTTTVRSIMGLQPCHAGTIHFRGAPIQNARPQRIAQRGIALVPEGRQIFPNLTVRENLVAFAANRSGQAAPWTLDRVYDLFPILWERAGHMGRQLSGGEQQMLAIGRALMTNPHLLILDEATEGLAPLLRAQIWDVLAQIKALGQTVLVIDKYVDQLLAIADQHTLIERGRVVWQGASAELAARADLLQRYLGV